MLCRCFAVALHFLCNNPAATQAQVNCKSTASQVPCNCLGANLRASQMLCKLNCFAAAELCVQISKPITASMRRGERCALSNLGGRSGVRGSGLACCRLGFSRPHGKPAAEAQGLAMDRGLRSAVHSCNASLACAFRWTARSGSPTSFGLDFWDFGPKSPWCRVAFISRSAITASTYRVFTTFRKG